MRLCLGKLRNRQLAHAVLTAFLAGFLGLPCLHNLAHQRDHSHGPDGHSIRWHDTDHNHAHAASGPDRSPTGAAVGRPAPPAHGPGGAAHFAVGILGASPFLLPPPAAEAVVLSAPPAPVQPSLRFCHAVARPRGPPAVV